MPLFQDMYNMGEPKIDFDRAPVRSSTTLSFDGKWRLTGDRDAECVVSTIGIMKTSNPIARPFIDTDDYTFGVEVVEAKKGVFVAKVTEKSKLRHEVYVKAIEDLGLAETDSVVRELLAFMKDDPYKKITEGLDEEAVNLVNKALYRTSIRVLSDDGTVLAEKYADIINAYEVENALCAFSGKIEPVMRDNVERLTGIRGTLAQGVKLACSNSDRYSAVRNYGFEFLNGSPLSARSFTRILRNLQSLLNDPMTNIRIPNSDNTSYVVKYDGVSRENETQVSCLMSSPSKIDMLPDMGFDDEDLTDEAVTVMFNKKKEFKTCAQIVYDKYIGLHKGHVSGGKLGGHVTIYRLHGANGRWSCTGEYKIDVATLFANIDRWYTDTVVSGTASSIYSLLASANAKDEKVQPRDYENLLHAAMFGTPINKAILRKAVYRIFSQGHSPRKNQCALIRACYNNAARKAGTKEIMPMLDKTNTTLAYNLGRLLSVADYMQKNANPNIETFVSDRLRARAKRRPKECFAELNDRISKYRTQLRCKNPGALIRCEQMTSEILSIIKPSIESFAEAPLTVDEQVHLILGMNDQTTYIYTKKEAI